MYDFINNFMNDPVITGTVGLLMGLFLSFIFGSLRSMYRKRFVLPKLKMVEDARRKAETEKLIKELIGPLKDAITKIENY